MMGSAGLARILGAAAAVSAVGLSTPAADAGTASIELPSDATTSAGVFDADGHLIRTLWSARRMPKGVPGTEFLTRASRAHSGRSDSAWSVADAIGPAMPAP